MRYFMILTGTPPEAPPPPELMEAIFKLGDEATQAGALVDTAGLQPSAMGGARIELAGGSVSVVDGPFAESKELISYSLYEVKTREEAIEWATRFLRLHQDLWPGWEGTTTLQKVFGPEDMPPQE